MLANVYFKGYEFIKNRDNDIKNKPIIDFKLDFIDIDKIDLITESIQKAYEFACPIHWHIVIDHEYI